MVRPPQAAGKYMIQLRIDDQRPVIPTLMPTMLEQDLPYSTRREAEGEDEIGELLTLPIATHDLRITRPVLRPSGVCSGLCPSSKHPITSRSCPRV
jgi:hypothetical protein